MKIVNKIATKLSITMTAAIAAFAPIATAVAEQSQDAAGVSSLAPLGAGLAIGMAVVGGALGQGKVVGSMLESFGRNPSVGGKLLTPMMIGMVLIESLVILAFVIAFRM
jgi:F-type H+-transporting ATPase subunit c